MSYALLKLIHLSAVAASGCGFIARGLGVLRGAVWVRSRPARILPQVIDTLLLLSAVGMLWSLRVTPWALPWLCAKLIGLVFYIALGVIALRPSRRSLRTRCLAWLAALLVFAYIVSVAVTKSPLGAFAWLAGTASS